MFFLSTLVVMIILLNLLIAIMGDTYDKITETGENATYMELVQMIVENGYLIRKSQLKKIKYLILVQDEDFSSSGIGQWHGRMAALKGSMDSKNN